MTRHEDVQNFAQAIERTFGHQHHEHHAGDLGALLEARMRRAGARDYKSYRHRLDESPAEWEALAPLLTVPETYFFRMPAHFDALVTDALPRILQANRDTRTLRILSAGCASGEEPYTLRIMLNESFPELKDWNTTIVGVDLSEPALTRARAGVYTKWSLRATSDERRRANFVTQPRQGEQFKLLPAARTGVEFRRENLLEPAPPNEAKFDIIFCRNVLIYFSDAAIRQAIDYLTQRLVPEGYLFLGPAESLRGVSRDFHLCHHAETFFYRRKATQGETPKAASRSPDPTWFESIRDSSARLDSLVSKGKPAVQPPPPQTKPSISKSDAKTRTTPDTLERKVVKSILAERPGDALALLDANPATLTERSLRAVILTSLGRTAEAEAECHRLLERDELNPEPHYLLGLNYGNSGQFEAAEDAMNATLFLDPGFAMAHVHCGLIARQRARQDRAHAAFTLALKFLPAASEDHLALFGGGFSRESLRILCTREVARDLAGNSK